MIYPVHEGTFYLIFDKNRLLKFPGTISADICSWRINGKMIPEKYILQANDIVEFLPEGKIHYFKNRSGTRHQYTEEERIFIILKAVPLN
jgi:hypothetical protein